MQASELREKYIQFFEQRGHKRISGYSLVPENDPTVLFTTAGMHPLVPYIMGESHPEGTRLVNCQRCIRTGDIDEVGDQSHLTFFEMLGNWSLGDYFKDEAITMSFEFLTDSAWLGIPKEKLAISVYGGSNAMPPDEESLRIWESLGIPRDKIFFLDEKHNVWGPVGATGPCGPDTEMFIDTGRGNENSTPANDDRRYLEIWNDVFMQYNKTEQGYEPLERKCVDTGMGLERTAAVLQGKLSVFATELFQPILKRISDIAHTSYNSTEESARAMRIITDHTRTAVFLLGNEQAIVPSNVGQGYILRRLIRRAMRYGRTLNIDSTFLVEPAEVAINIYADSYPLLAQSKDFILTEIQNEEHRFLDTLRRGEREFHKLRNRLNATHESIIMGNDVFHLYDTYGFPKEVTAELAKEAGLSIDDEGFEAAFTEHQRKSKLDDKQTFKGGLADNSDETTKLHTATHLLHQSLRMVLGDHVGQKGSNITKDRLRFDFSHPEKMTAEQITKVESIVNEQIQAALPITMETIKLEEAKQQGAIALFGGKYDEVVKVFSIGNFSKEVCGGPHVHNTKELGIFKIQKEQSSSQGIRRIKAVLLS